MLIAAFIILVIILLLYVPVSFTAAASFEKEGVDLMLSARIARIITLYGWDSKEEGLDFLFRRQVQRSKKKKKRVNAITGRVFNPKAILNIKHMTVAAFEVRGMIATHDAALTALVYGALCSIISIIIPFIKSNGVKVDFYPDFQQNQPDFHISCIIRVRLMHIIYLLVEAFRDTYLKGRWHSLWNRILLKN